MLIAIIPARGGSKGLPGKNIKLLGGRPLIQWTVQAALGADCINRVIVTTDSQEIASAAREVGAEVPFLRPSSLASDDASAVDVYLHVIDWLESDGVDVTKFMVLLPTVPFRTAEDIDAAYDTFVCSEAETLVSMKEADIPPGWYFTKNGEGLVENARFGSTGAVANRQLGERYYVPNGAIYILDRELLSGQRTYYGSRTVAYIMPPERSVDIDTPLDFLFADCLVSNGMIQESL